MPSLLSTLPLVACLECGPELVTEALAVTDADYSADRGSVWAGASFRG